MHPMCDLLLAILDLSLIVAHAGAQPTPVPHWVVLLAGVIGLWVAIGSGVIVVDRFLAWLP